jgi:hypothetical protein
LELLDIHCQTIWRCAYTRGFSWLPAWFCGPTMCMICIMHSVHGAAAVPAWHDASDSTCCTCGARYTAKHCTINLISRVLPLKGGHTGAGGCSTVHSAAPKGNTSSRLQGCPSSRGPTPCPAICQPLPRGATPLHRSPLTVPPGYRITPCLSFKKNPPWQEGLFYCQGTWRWELVASCMVHPFITSRWLLNGVLTLVLSGACNGISEQEWLWRMYGFRSCCL